MLIRRLHGCSQINSKVAPIIVSLVCVHPTEFVGGHYVLHVELLSVTATTAYAVICC